MTGIRSIFIILGSLTLAAFVTQAFRPEGYGLREFFAGKAVPAQIPIPVTPESAPTEVAPTTKPEEASGTPPTSAPENAQPPAPAPEATTADADTLPLAEGLSREFEALAQRVFPSVVSVHTSKELISVKIKLDERGRRTWDEFSEHQPGVGSGIIVREDGLILTNFHVIDGVSQIYVSLHNGAEAQEVDVVGYNKKADIAVLRLRQPAGSERKYPVLKFGDSNSVRPGSLVLAFGAPFGLSESVTQGMVSNTKRKLSGNNQTYLQTQTPINPGSSGGPLVNLKGEVIGVTCAIYSGQSEIHVWQGIGLAIPSNDVKLAMDNILQTRTFTGLSVEEVSSFADPQGVLITAVDKGSPAEQAGLAAADLIVRIDGETVRKPEDLWRLVGRRKAGEEVGFVVMRQGKEVPTMQVKLVDADAVTSHQADASWTTALGLELRDANLEDYQKLLAAQWTGGRQFIVVTEVAPGSTAEEGGVQVGDVLLALETDPTAEPDLCPSVRALHQKCDTLKPGSSARLIFWQGPDTPRLPIQFTK